MACPSCNSEDGHMEGCNDPSRCNLACPHGDRCVLNKDAEFCSHRGCFCNEPNAPIDEAEADPHATCGARIRALMSAISDLLMSADSSWEEKNGGHDWPESVARARAVLAGEIPHSNPQKTLCGSPTCQAVLIEPPPGGPRKLRANWNP